MKSLATWHFYLQSRTTASRSWLCVSKEHLNRKEVTIRIASNTGDLLAVTSGFVTLAKTLEQAARRENSKANDKKAFFQEVVALDLHRILSRLRSRHAKRTQKTAGKPALIIQLNQALNDKSVKATLGFAESSLKSTRDKARALLSLFTRLESISTPSAGQTSLQELIGEIVVEAHEFTVSTDLSAALQTFSGNPNLKNHLLEAIGKLGRYYSASSELVCAARDQKCPVFQNIKVEAFRIQVPASVQEANCKVHAEIQLIFFYELHPDYPRPRIICSSKSACYLCNLFFHLHGGFHVPHTHGKLYDKWILPDWLDVPPERHRDLGMVSTQLKATLDGKIRMALRSKKSISYHPNESILLPYAHWPSTPALSGNLTPLSSASKSTIRPRPCPIYNGISNSRSSPCAELPLSPPRTPLSTCEAANSDTDSTTAPRSVDLAGNSIENMPASDDVSLINVGDDELPYSQSITLTTPSLHLQLDKLSVTLDFVQVLSGHLSIMHVGNAVTESKGNPIDVNDIPMATELRFNCPHGSDELKIYLRNAMKEFICVVFVWDGPLTGTMTEEILRSQS